MDRVLFTVGDIAVTLEIAAYAAAGLFAVLLVALLVKVILTSQDTSNIKIPIS